MRPSRSKGAYNVDKSFPVTMMGTRRTMSSSRQSWISSSDSSLTRFGWSHRFMSVPTTICMFTVFCVCLNVPAPASMSCTIRHEG